jgi:hypothetical protein
MPENIIAEIKILYDPIKLIDAFIHCFAPDIKAVSLRIEADEAGSREVIFSNIYTWQSDLVSILIEQYLEHHWLPKIILTFGIQLSSQGQDWESLPSPQLLVVNSFEEKSATLDFDHSSYYNAHQLHLASGRTLETGIILEALQHICREIQPESLYVLNQWLDPSPWNCPFIYYDSSQQYLQDLIKLGHAWEDFQQGKIAVLFRGQNPEQTAILHEFLADHSLVFRMAQHFPKISTEHLAAIWQKDQRRSGALSNFNTFMTEVGIGLFTNHLCDEYCNQPYLALLKYLDIDRETLSPEDIVQDVAELPTPEQQGQEEDSLATILPDEIEIELQLTLGQPPLAQQCFDAVARLIGPADLQALLQYFRDNLTSLTTLEQILKTQPHPLSVKGKQRRQYLPSLGKSNSQLELLVLRQNSFKELAKIDHKTPKDNQVWLTNPAQIVRKITHQNLLGQATILYEVPLGDSVTWSNSKMPLFWMDIAPPHPDQIIVIINATELTQDRKPQSLPCKVNISGAAAQIQKRLNELKQSPEPESN